MGSNPAAPTNIFKGLRGNLQALVHFWGLSGLQPDCRAQKLGCLPDCMGCPKWAAAIQFPPVLQSRCPVFDAPGRGRTPRSGRGRCPSSRCHQHRRTGKPGCPPQPGPRLRGVRAGVDQVGGCNQIVGCILSTSTEGGPDGAYKFVPAERIDILRNGRIRFTPALLNDPFEMTRFWGAYGGR